MNGHIFAITACLLTLWIPLRAPAQRACGGSGYRPRAGLGAEIWPLLTEPQLTPPRGCCSCNNRQGCSKMAISFRRRRFCSRYRYQQMRLLSARAAVPLSCHLASWARRYGRFTEPHFAAPRPLLLLLQRQGCSKNGHIFATTVSLLPLQPPPRAPAQRACGGTTYMPFGGLDAEIWPIY